MKTQSCNPQTFHYGVDAVSKISTDYYPLEKVAKISYRMLDLAGIFFNNFPSPLITLSSQIKDLVLAIESTRFVCVSFPVFFPKNGPFFKNKTYVQCAERISIISHLALKTLFGADRVKLIRLGILATYGIGHLSFFKWAIEGTVFFFNFFGSWDGTATVIRSNSNLAITKSKLEKWGLRKKAFETTSNSPDRITAKLKKWEIIKANLEIEKNRGVLKIAAKVSKLVLIVFATTLGAINVWSISCLATILSLGVISDAFGLAEFFYQEYRKPQILLA